MTYPRKLPIWAWAGGGVVVVVLLSLLIPGAGIGSTSQPTTTLPLPVKITTTPAYEASLSTFERDTKIPTLSWYPHVTYRELQNSGASLWVSTDLTYGDASKTVAQEICRVYAQYEKVDARVRTTVVHASDTRTLARCGPDA